MAPSYLDVMEVSRPISIVFWHSVNFQAYELLECKQSMIVCASWLEHPFLKLWGRLTPSALFAVSHAYWECLMENATAYCGQNSVQPWIFNDHYQRSLARNICSNWQATLTQIISTFNTEDNLYIYIYLHQVTSVFFSFN